MADIIALIPANNESEHIQSVVAGARKYLPVWVVDDGSTDDTAALAEAAGARVFRQMPNQGKGVALRTGFRHALADGLEAVITLDGDGQHDPAEIPAFLNAYAQRPVGLIIGMRDYRQIPLFRRMTNTLGRIMISWALGEYIPDNQSGYRLIARSMLGLLVDSLERGFELEVDMITLCLKRKLGLSWVPIRTIYAGQASHIRKMSHLVNYFRITYKAWRAMRSG